MPCIVVCNIIQNFVLFLFQILMHFIRNLLCIIDQCKVVHNRDVQGEGYMVQKLENMARFSI